MDTIKPIIKLIQLQMFSLLWIMTNGLTSTPVSSCPFGWGLDKTGMCGPCPSNTYKNTSLEEECRPCPLDKYGHPMTSPRGSRSCDVVTYILSMDPNFGPRAGGTNVSLQIAHMVNRTLTGINFSSHATSLIVKGESSDSRHMYTAMTAAARDKPLNGTVSLFVHDNVERRSITVTTDQYFTYLPDPSVTGISRNSTISSGGIAIEVYGAHLTSVARPLVIITVTKRFVDSRTVVESCNVSDSKKMICRLPDLKRVLGDSAADTSTLSQSSVPERSSVLKPANPVSKQTNDLNDPDIEFYLGFLLDGVKQYEKFQKLEVYQDPVWYRFTEKDHVRFFTPSENTDVIILGERLDDVLTVADVTVHVGTESCDITFFVTNQLTCTAPAKKLSNRPAGSGPRGSIPVVVRFGHQTAVVGYLRYPDDYSLSLVKVVVILACSLVMGLAVLVWCCCCWCSRKRRQNQKKKLDAKTIEGYLTAPAENSQATTYTRLDKNVLSKVTDCIIPDKQVTVGQSIGQGQFGKVFKGKFKTRGRNVSVAIKTVQSGGSSDAVAEFLDEALVMKGFNHEHVVKMYGVVIKDNIPHVVLEYMDLGDLKTYIGDPKVELMISHLVRFCVHIARGMAYLAENKFVHRDLAARNCMINSKKVVKIADFGLSRDIYVSDYYRAETRDRPLPLRWMALESMETGVFTVKTDVLSFGVVVWELFTRGAKPYADVTNYQLKSYLQLGKRMDKPKHCPPQVFGLVQACWNEHAYTRPSFMEIESSLSKLLNNYSSNIYSKSGKNEDGYVNDGYLKPVS